MVRVTRKGDLALIDSDGLTTAMRVVLTQHPMSHLVWDTRTFSLPVEHLAPYVKQFGLEQFELSAFQDLPDLKPFWQPHIIEGFAPEAPTYTTVYDPIHTGTSRDFQAVGSTFIIEHEACILGDEQGLGKTKQFIDAVMHFREPFDVLIITRKSIVDVWLTEIARFAPCAAIHDVSSSAKLENDLGWEEPQPTPRVTFFVTTFETMSAHSELLGSNFDWVCIDEGHKIKSNPMGGQAAMAANVHDIWAPRRTILTASPMTLGPEDAWNLFHWLEIDKRSWLEFQEQTLRVEFDPYSNRRFVKDYLPHGLTIIREMFDCYMLRRLKKDAIPDLPPKTFETITYTLTDAEEQQYLKARRDLQYYADKYCAGDPRKIPSDNVLVLRLRQITTDAKLKVAHLLATRHCDTEKVIVYSQYRDAIDKLTVELAGYSPAVLTGSTTKRSDVVHRFQTDNACRVFIGSTPACREGITLTAASVVVFIEKEWSPKYTEQAIDRAHRIGQTRPVKVYSIQAVLSDGSPTIDFGVEQNAKKKQRNISRVLASA
jgi:SNF2 family DNA or RNA helicase